MKRKLIMLLPDLHMGHHDRPALRCALKAHDYLKPDHVVILGDWLDAHSFNMHGPTPEERRAHYIDDEVEPTKRVLERLEEHSHSLTFIEGNHEYRVARMVAKQGGPWRDVAQLVSPERLLSQGRNSEFEWIPYADPERSKFASIAPGLVACHGLSEARHAAYRHLEYVRGLSVVHGHTHRQQSHTVRHPITGDPIHAWSPGCLSELQPVWAKRPTAWSHGFSVIYLDGENWTNYTVTINRGRCVMPDGKTIESGEPGTDL